MQDYCRWSPDWQTTLCTKYRL